MLKDWLVDAVTATLAQGETSLTEEVLTRTMPHPAKRVSLEMEARAGERQVAHHDSEGAKQFQALLKKPAPAANGKAEPTPGSMAAPPPVAPHAQEATSGPARAPMPQVAPKPTHPRVGQRAPGRDPVGDTSAVSVRNTVACAFTDFIEVTLVQLEETGISRFECPTCLAVRELKPKGGQVRFPAHPKRLTTTLNHGKRWVRRGSRWEPAD